MAVKVVKERPCASCGVDIGTTDYYLIDGRNRTCIDCGDRQLGRFAGDDRDMLEAMQDAYVKHGQAATLDTALKGVGT